MRSRPECRDVQQGGTAFMIDAFAWIVLLILVASAIAIFFIAGSLPGHIAKAADTPRRKPSP
jgi:hypothetical protein